MNLSYNCLRRCTCRARKDFIRAPIWNMSSDASSKARTKNMEAVRFYDQGLQSQKEDRPNGARPTRPIDVQYENAIKALNGLQSNAALLDVIRKRRKTIANTNLAATQLYLERVGVPLDTLDKLPVIHLAGTKGKGSTCALIESILREHGLKTGMYTSPHLVAARERIRINGIPISKKEFSYYFWDVYDTLSSHKTDPSDMPAYFKFLTVLALKIFLKEDVDVAVVEVGIGGEYDCTNVIRNPVVCGITSLDIDHTSLLGDTIEQIAWHKAGIMKPSVPTFTVGQQPPNALPVLFKRAEEKKTRLFFCPPLENYCWGSKAIHLGLSGYVQFLNASLALQLSHYFMRKRGILNSAEENLEQCRDFLCGKTFELSEEDIFGLKNVVWPGRSQVLKDGRTTFFLDGAHTILSIQSCIDWYMKTSQLHVPAASSELVYKILIFNITGDRDHEQILGKLFPCNFDLAIFTTNSVTKERNASSDQTNFTVSEAKQIATCEKLRNYWLHLAEEKAKKCILATEDKVVTLSEGMESPMTPCLSERTENPETEAPCLSERIENPETETPCLIFPCIQDVLSYISCGNRCHPQGTVSQEISIEPPKRLKDAPQVQVLVTGSLHLVGGFLAILDPSLSQQSQSPSTAHPTSSMADLVKRKYVRSQFSTPGTP